MIATHLETLLKKRLSMLQREGLYRQRVARPVKVVEAGLILPGEGQGERILNFSSNDYLGFANDTHVRRFFQEGYERYPAGSGASAVIEGYHPAHHALEEALADMQGAQAALYFNSGYTANLSLLMFLSSLDMSIIIDKAVHASVYDGLKLTGAQYERFLHQDLNSLEIALQKAEKPAIVMTEGIFSMSGQIAPLECILALCEQYDALCVLDEAHSFGIVGPHGLGLAHACGASFKRVPLRLLAFGKATGAQGAAIVGEKIWIDALLQTARPYIYSTAPAPALAYGLLQTLALLFDANDRRSQLQARIEYFRQSIQNLSWQGHDSHTPIQSFHTGCPMKAMELANTLQKQNIFCKPIRQPTVTLKETGLRIVLSANHVQEDIDRLMQAWE